MDIGELFENMLGESRPSTQKQVMQRAWRRARAAAKRFGGSPKDFISETMRTAWKTQRSVGGAVKKAVGDVQKSKEPLNQAKAELAVLIGVLRDAQIYGDTGDSDGAVLESMNASRLIEFIEDLRIEYGEQWIIDNIKNSGKSVHQIAEDLVVITRAHYDDAYAAWAGGTENFKQALRDLERALAGAAGSYLTEMFFG